MFDYNENESKVIVLMGELHKDPKKMVGILSDPQNLANKTNFSINVKVGFNVKSIGGLIGENICSQFNVVKNKLQLKVKKEKMVQLPTITVTQVETL